MPILSIIIPTRERVEYLRSAIKSCIAIEEEDIEIIVSDNASQDETRQLVININDSRVRYINTNRRVSMRENYEFALNSAEGDHFIMIGDDDAVIPSSVEKFIRILRKDKPNLVYWSPPLYGWPSENGKSDAHLLVTQPMLFGGYERVSTETLVTSLYDGSLKTQRIMPSIYHGCVSRILMNRIKAHAGQFFGAANPDCYVSFAACLLSSDYVILRHPVTIAGASPRSNAANQEGSHALFMTEAKTDSVFDPLDCSSLAVSAHYLSTLLAANLVSQQPRKINWARWVERTVAEIRQMYPSLDTQNVHIMRLKSEIERLGGFFPDISNQTLPTAKKKRSRGGSKFSLNRIRLRFNSTSTVNDAVEVIEKIGSIYQFKQRNIINDIFIFPLWLKALIESSTLSLSRR